MRNITSIGVWLFAATLIGSGLFYFIYPSYLTEQLHPSLPGGDAWAYVAGVAMVIAGVTAIIGKFDSTAMFILGILLMLYALIIHLPMALLAADKADMVLDASLVSRDLMLAGAALMYSHYVANDPRGPRPDMEDEE